MDDEEIFTTQEAAEFLGLGVGTLVEARRTEGPRDGRMRGPRCIRMGRLVRYRRSDLQRWLAERGDARVPAQDLIEQHGENFGHEHLSDWLNTWTESDADIIISRSTSG